MQNYKDILKHKEITGIQINSSKIMPGDAFFCIVGLKTDGHKYTKDAIAKGASIVVCQHKIDGIDDNKQIIVKDTRHEVAKFADAFYKHPSKTLKVIGITGTNGKTTTTHIIDHVLRQAGLNTAIIGTTGIKINGKPANPKEFSYGGFTTPESFTLQEMFAKFVKLGVSHVLIEVSSHSLMMQRVTGINFAVTGFTNLTQDHLDYHKTMQNYFEAKAKLFSDEYQCVRCICTDDDYGKKLADMSIGLGQETITCGLNNEADVSYEKYKCDFPLIGKFNKQNMLLSFAICKALGINDSDIKKALASTPSVEGRMQRVVLYEGVNFQHDDRFQSASLPLVCVDFAHTPDALENALLTLKEDCKGNLVVVFGCGGDRDAGKRPKMGSVACKYADKIYVTSDNPRTENPDEIIKDILDGIKSENVFVIPDRKEAIFSAIKNSNDDDTILIAGKGHEKNQIIGTKEIPFDDVKVSQSALEERIK